ncbi:MAG: hypothetical protein ABIQ12_13790 [Opitutaceae bacterium]
MEEIDYGKARFAQCLIGRREIDQIRQLTAESRRVNGTSANFSQFGSNNIRRKQDKAETSHEDRSDAMEPSQFRSHFYARSFFNQFPSATDSEFRRIQTP